MNTKKFVDDNPILVLVMARCRQAFIDKNEPQLDLLCK